MNYASPQTRRITFGTALFALAAVIAAWITGASLLEREAGTVCLREVRYIRHADVERFAHDIHRWHLAHWNDGRNIVNSREGSSGFALVSRDEPSCCSVGERYFPILSALFAPLERFLEMDDIEVIGRRRDGTPFKLQIDGGRDYFTGCAIADGLDRDGTPP